MASNTYTGEAIVRGDIRDFFPNARSYIVFCLTKLNMVDKVIALQIDERFFNDQRFAKEWLEIIESRLNDETEIADQKGVELALLEAKNLYQLMTFSN